MKKDHNIINKPDVRAILELLRDEPMTKESLILQLHLSEKNVSDALSELLDGGWITIESLFYRINESAFEEAAVDFMRFCGRHNEAARDDTYHIDVNQALCEHLFTNRELEFHYAAFDRELAFYESVRSGNIETVKTLYTPLGGEGFGTLSKDPLQNLKYHLVVSIAMITRFCINGGMLPEDAYALSDVYVMKTDECEKISDIHSVHYEMMIDFTKRMRQIKNGCVYSRPVLQALDYIGDHLHSRIFIEDAAEHLSLSVPYLSRLFRKELKMPFSQYVTLKKIEAAASMLQFSDYTALDISNYFAFSSHSYFIKMFKKHIGLTPKEYRDKYYAIGWIDHIIEK